MKGKENLEVAFKEERKEAYKPCDKEENDRGEIQAMFQSEV